MSLRYHARQPVSAAQLSRYLESALTFARRAGEVILPHFRTAIEIENKAGEGRFDPVTAADKAAEKRIREEIAAAYPDHAVFGEEHDYQPGNGLTWVVDPIDGTRAFMTGMLHWGVLIALFDGEEPILGVMHQPFTDEYFFGTNTEASYRRGTNQATLRARKCEGLAHATLASTGAFLNASAEEHDAFHAVRRNVRLTRYGGDCYLYCLLAMGLIDLAIEVDLKPYDIQALMPIIRGAGGVVTTWDGGNPAMGGRIVAAGDARVHRAAMQILERRAG